MDCIGFLNIISLSSSKVICFSKHNSVNVPSNQGDSCKVVSNLKFPLFTQSVAKIGRGKSCTIQINNLAVSLHHLTIWSVQFDVDCKPIVYVIDNSRNGVLHNSEEMQKGEIRYLRHGDKLELKTACTIEFFESESCSVIDSPAMSQVAQSVNGWQISSIKLGSGSFGSVHIARSLIHKGAFAVKIIPKQKTSRFDNSKVFQSREATLLSKINHPNIIKIHEAIENNNKFYIFQDLICGGDLFSYLVNDNYLKAIPEREAIFIVFQIMKALQFLHKNLLIVHRDLKLDNVLMHIPLPKSRIYLCDFGIAKQLPSGRTTTCVGTIEYSAPEVFKCDSNGRAIEAYNFKCDIWSLGIITHILLSGISPFYAHEKASILLASREGKLNFNRKQFSHTSSLAQRFVSALLKVDASKRLDIDECFEHGWIKRNKAKLEAFYRDHILI